MNEPYYDDVKCLLLFFRNDSVCHWRRRSFLFPSYDLFTLSLTMQKIHTKRNYW